MYFMRNGKRYGIDNVLLLGRRKLHKVMYIAVDDRDEKRLWQDIETVCGQQPPWAIEDGTQGEIKQHCWGCIGWQQEFETKVPADLRPTY